MTDENNTGKDVVENNDLLVHVFPPFEPEKPQDKTRRFGFEKRQVPVRVLIPNILTLIGLIAGLTAIRMAIEGRYEPALMCVVLAAFFDALDGRIARLLKASSRFGAELDSLADFVNFGVAPAVIIFTWALGDLKNLGWIVVLTFALCAALRLARFNVSLEATSQPHWKSNFFVGVPAPAGALLLLLPLYLEGLGLGGYIGGAMADVMLLMPLILIYTLFVAFLMVSRLPTYSGKLVGQMIGREYVLPIFVLAVMYFAVLATYPYTTMTFGAVMYLLMLPVSFWRYKKLEKNLPDEPEIGAAKHEDAEEQTATPSSAGASDAQPLALKDRLKSANDD